MISLGNLKDGGSALPGAELTEPPTAPGSHAAMAASEIRDASGSTATWCTLSICAVAGPCAHFRCHCADSPLQGYAGGQRRKRKRTAAAVSAIVLVCYPMTQCADAPTVVELKPAAARLSALCCACQLPGQRPASSPWPWQRMTSTPHSVGSGVHGMARRLLARSAPKPSRGAGVRACPFLFPVPRVQGRETRAPSSLVPAPCEDPGLAE
jgi:hypothetical protein